MVKRWIYPLPKPEIIEKITFWLNKLPRVKWDRMSQKRGHLYIFGWIDRKKDSYKDFFLIDFVKGNPRNYCSSDTKFNLKYGKILGLYNQKCERIEDLFKGVKNVVKLK